MKKNKFKQYPSTNPGLQKTLKGQLQLKEVNCVQETTGNK